MEWLENVIIAAQSQSWIEWLAVIFSLIYVVLAALENRWCWFFGIIGVVASFYIYLNSKFFLDAGLQIYYFIMSIYGWVSWSWKKRDAPLPISTRNLMWHLAIILLGIVIAYPLGLISQYFGGTLPFIDALTTSFSLIATWMVARKILENWLYWIVIDLICIWAYWNKGLELFAVLFFFYSIVAIIGYISWNKKSPIRSISQNGA